jgi:hypothetical protein
MRVTVLHVRARDPPKARYFPTRWALNAAADALAKAERTGGDFAAGTMTTSTIGMILVHRPGAEREAGPLAVLAEVREGRFGVASPQAS